MKVLLIQYWLGRKEPEGTIFPLGLAYIAAALKDHDVRMIDLNHYDDPYEELKKVIGEFKPQVAGISLRNIDTTLKRDVFYYFKTIQPTARLIREADPEIKIVIGGAGYSMFAKEVLQKVPELDFGVFLEGEESFPELLKNLDNPETVKGLFIRKGNDVSFTGPRRLPNFGSLPMPRRDLVDSKKYLHPKFPNIGIQTKRGCPFKCAYCSYPFLNGPKMRTRSSESVVDEIEYMQSELKIDRFMFADSVFNVPKGHAEDICNEILKRKLNVNWDAWFEVKSFTEELMLLAKKAGCRNMSFSPDAASNKSLKAMGKGFTEKDIYRVVDIAKRGKGINFGFGFFCTPPGQDFMGFLKTIKMYVSIHLALFGRGGASLSWVRVEPETKMYEIALEEGMLSSGDTLLPDDEKGLEKLFYSCPATRSYADPFFWILTEGKEKLKPFVKRLLGRK